MANVDKPRGLWPIRHLTGGEIRTTEYTVTTSATIYRGDPVKVVAGGTVEVSAAADATIVIGVAAEYIGSAAAGSTIPVYDDPNIVFGVQCDSGTAPAATDVFACADPVTYLAGDTTTLISNIELDASDIGAKAAALKILGLIDEPYNTWGEHANVEVIFNEHFLFGSRPNGV
jgi:hypothetical protein